MAMHTELPIYKVAYDLLSLATDITRNIPRDLKAGLGAKIRDECIECKGFGRVKYSRIMEKIIALRRRNHKKMLKRIWYGVGSRFDASRKGGEA